MAKREKRSVGGPFMPHEREFVRSAYPQLGPSEIARKLGRSKSGVCGLIRRMRETGEIAPAESAGRSAPSLPKDRGEGLREEGGRQDTLGRLRRLRDLLGSMLADASPGHAARLAAEYRATVDEIARIEGEAGGSDGEDAVEGLVRALARRVGGA